MSEAALKRIVNRLISHGLVDADQIEEFSNVRKCSHCSAWMIEGYIMEDLSYYCSDACLYANVTKEEYLKQHDNGNGDSFYTTWEDLG